MNKLRYFKSFNESNVLTDEKPQDYWKDKNWMFSLDMPEQGGVYKLTFGIRGNSFLLEQPDGSRLIGTIDDLYNNVDEVARLSQDDEIRKWMLFNHQTIYNKDSHELTEERVADDTLIYLDLNINGRMHWLAYDTYHKKGMLKIPLRVMEFELDNLYFDIPELPLLDDGLLNQRVREEIAKLGGKLPKTPYELGFAITGKRDG
jgi:hypothetical protein